MVKKDKKGGGEGKGEITACPCLIIKGLLL